MRCRSVHRLADPAYLSRFLFPGLPCVTPYCVLGGVRVVSISPSYPPSTKGSLVRVLRPSSKGSKEPQRRHARDNPSPHPRMHLQPVVEAARERPESVLGRVVSLYRSVEIAGVPLRP